VHDTLDDVGIVFLNNEPYVIAVMATNLPTLDAGYHFIHGISRVAYAALQRFADWRAENGGGTTVLDAPVAQAPVPLVAPDQRMWTPEFPEPALAGAAPAGDAR
jgi:hypothetical protein